MPEIPLRSKYSFKGMKPENLKLLKTCLFRELKSPEIKSVDDITEDHANEKQAELLKEWVGRWVVHMKAEKEEPEVVL